MLGNNFNWTNITLWHCVVGLKGDNFLQDGRSDRRLLVDIISDTSEWADISFTVTHLSRKCVVVLILRNVFAFWECDKLYMFYKYLRHLVGKQ